MLTKLRQNGSSVPPAPALLLGKQRDGAVGADREHFVDTVEIGVFSGILDEWPIAADARDDGFSRLRMDADLTRQSEQFQCGLQIEVVDHPSFRDAGALGLL